MKWLSVLWLLSVIVMCPDYSLTAQSIVIRNAHQIGNEANLAYHYGKSIITLKTQFVDENGFVFFYNKSLHSGIYYIYFSDSSSVEFMYDSLSPGKISIEFLEDNNTYKIDGPIISKSYFEFQQETTKLATIKRNNGNINPKSIQIKNDSILNYYSGLFPNSILSAYLSSQKPVKIPEYSPPKTIINTDSAIWVYNLNYYNKHFLDYLDLADSRLIYTPVYTEMIDRFLEKATRQNQTDIFSTIQHIIGRTKNCRECEIFVTNYLLVKYERKKNNPVYEHVYVNIIEKYFLKSGASWINNAQMSLLTNEFNRHKPGLLGEYAPEIKLTNISGIETDLTKISEDYIVLLFYTYDCPLCNKIIPELKKIVSRYDYLNIAVLAICLGEDTNKWKSFVLEKKIGHWTNLFNNTQNIELVLKYNLSYTPAFYLLNNQKIIIDKNFTVARLEKTLFDEATHTAR